GYITYMRTDSTPLSATAVAAARSHIEHLFGREFLPQTPRVHARRSKSAQEAHEALRPAGERFRSPAEVASEVPPAEARVYELIWKRTLASQMTDVVGETVSLRLGATSASGREVRFSASGTVISHRGFREVYSEGRDDDRGEVEDERRLPSLQEGDPVRGLGLEAEGHVTQPPPRFTEASLVKKLEELEVGRPSTYASIIGTIQDRGYVWKKGSALVPSFTAFSVINLLEAHFPDLVDYAFTARMEDDLDQIAKGREEPVPWLSRFYFGDTGAGGEDQPGLKEKVSERLAEIDARSVNTIPLGMSGDGHPVAARVGRYGPYVQLGDSDDASQNQTASIPDDIPPDELTIDKAMGFLAAPSEGRRLGIDPATGLEVFAKAGRFGPYVQLGDADQLDDKPKTASLFQTMTIERVTLDEALQLLSLPRVLGADPADGVEITVQNGRYGPYVKKGSDSRSLENEEQLLTITLEECLAVLARPKRRRGQTVKPPLRDLGEDPATGKPMVVKDGRWGPYVTDAETNASLRKGDTVEELTIERASELLADRRAKGPTKKKAQKRAAKTKAGRGSAKKAAAGSRGEKAAEQPATGKSVESA
ncbi:MAG: topoisomerase C-terminal repeat-containing protein, partial [Acidimicrobiales bacterium]